MATSGKGRRTQWANAAGGRANSLVLSVLPNGPTAAQIGAGVLLDSNGNAVTCVRASPKYCRLNSAGSALVLLGNNQPAVEPEGLLVEAASTNTCLQSQTFSSASWSKIASSSVPVVTDNAMTAPDGTLTASQVVFPASGAGNFCLLRGTATAAAGANTFSLWIYSAAGVTIFIAGDDATYTTCVVPASVWTRFSNTTSPGAGAVTPDIGWNNPATATGPGATVFLWGAQFEAQAFSSSYIPTTTVAVARASDNCTTTLLRPISPTPSFSCDFTSKDLSANPVGVSIYNSSAERWGAFALSGGQLDVDYNNGSEFSSITPGGVITAGTLAHLVGSYDGTNMNAAVNGSNTATARSFAASASQANVGLGFSGWSNQAWLQGWLSKVKVYNKASAAT